MMGKAGRRRRSVLRGTILGGVAALAVGATPAAAAPWSDSRAFEGEAGVNVPIGPGVAFGSGGRGLAAWTPLRPQADDPFAPTQPLAGATLPARSDRFGAGTRLQPRRGRLRAQDFAVYGESRVIVSGLAAGRYEEPPVVAFGRLGERVGTPRTLLDGSQAALTRLASNERGDVALAVVARPRGAGFTRSRVKLLVRRAGGSFSRPVSMSPEGGIDTVSVTMNARGDVLVAAVRNRRVEVHVRTAGGRLLPRQDLGPVRPGAAVEGAIGDGRRAVAIWESQASSLGGGESEAVVGVAIAGRGGRFGAGRELERFGAEAPRPAVTVCAGDANESVEGAAQAGFDPNGDLGTVAWTGFEAGAFVVRAAAVDGGDLGPVQTFTGPRGVCPGDLATDADGRAVLLLEDDGSQAIDAALRLPGATRFDRREVVAGDADGGAAARAAIDPRSGRAVALWRRASQLRYAVRPPIVP